MSYSVTFSVLYIEVLESRVRDYYNGNMTTCIYSQLRTLLVHMTGNSVPYLSIRLHNEIIYVNN